MKSVMITVLSLCSLGGSPTLYRRLVKTWQNQSGIPLYSSRERQSLTLVFLVSEGTSGTGFGITFVKRTNDSKKEYQANRTLKSLYP